MTLFDTARADVALLTGCERILALYNHLNDLLSKHSNEMKKLSQDLKSQDIDDLLEQADRCLLHMLICFNEEKDHEVKQFVAEAKGILNRLGETDQAYMLNDIVTRMYVNAQEFQASVSYALVSCRYYEKHNNEQRLARTLNNLGMAYSNMHRVTDALPVLKRGLALNKKNNDPDIVNSYNNIASLYYRMRLLNKSLANYKLALEACHEQGRNDLEHMILNNIANINTDMGNYSEALKYYRQALQKNTDNQTNIAVTYNNIGIVYFFGEKYAEAIENFEQSLKVCRENRLSYSEAKNLYNLGQVYTEMNQFDQALRFLMESRPKVQQTGDLKLLTSVDVSLAELYIVSKRYDDAAALLEDIQQRPQDDQKDWADIEKALIKLYLATGDVKKLAHHRGKLLDRYEEKHQKEYAQLVAEMQVALDLELHEQEAEMQRQKAKELEKKNMEILQQKQRLEATLDELHRSEISYEFLQKEYKDQLGSIIIGESEQIKQLQSLIRLVTAASDTSVLITGETGTGKELVARAIHDLSDRKRRSFCAVNASSIPETLFESEFFGYRKNAFTGADRDKAGWFEIANDGTLFLDEVGTWRYDIQSKFLRVLESRKIIPVGGDREIAVDFRLISATNDDLQQMMLDNTFRTDLYYRLSSFIIHIPPLRERIEDIPLLLEYFVKHFSQRMNKRITRIEKQVETALCEYAFPGNVRELKNMVEHAMIISNTSTLRLSSFALPNHPFVDSVKTIAEVEKEMIVQALKRSNYNQSKAAEQLGLTPKKIERRMKKYGIVNPKHT